MAGAIWETRSSTAIAFQLALEAESVVTDFSPVKRWQ